MIDELEPKSMVVELHCDERSMCVTRIVIECAWCVCVCECVCVYVYFVADLLLAHN